MERNVKMLVVGIALFGPSLEACAGIVADVDVYGGVLDGRYRIGWQSNMARIELPDGTVQIVDCSQGTVTRLDRETKTYTVRTLQASLAGIGRFDSTKTSLQITPVPSNLSRMLSGLPATQSLVVAVSPRIDGNTPVTSTQPATLRWNGSVWSTDMARWSETPASFAPLAMTIGQGPMAIALTQKLDAGTTFPLRLNLSAPADNRSITLNVASLLQTDLTADLFKAPSDYRKGEVID